MFRTSLSIVLGFVLWLSTNASANVVYNWVTTSLHPYVSSVSGRIEVTDSAWLSGALANVEGPFDRYSWSSGGLVELKVDILRGPKLGEFSNADISLEGVDCSNPAPMHMPFCSSMGGAGLFDFGSHYTWWYDLDFSTAQLTINAMGTDGTRYARAHGDTIELEVDYGAGPNVGCQVIVCGTQGYWELDRLTIPISEPSEFVLVIVGLLILGAVRSIPAGALRSRL